MPKQIYKITAFHGGLNSVSDPRDIAENEQSEAIDVMVNEPGKVRLLGGISTSVEPPANVAVINAGYGLFHFSHDRKGGEAVLHEGTYTHSVDSGTVLIDSAAAFTSGLVGGTAYNLTDGSSGTVESVESTTQLTVDDLLGGSDNLWDASEDDVYVIAWPETEDNYLIMADTGGNASLDVYSSAADAWGTAKIDLGSTDGMKPAFFFIDGALRISDGNFGADNDNQWYGYIHRTHFSGLTPGGAADTYSGWYAKDAALAAPPVCLVSKLTGTTPLASSTNTVIETDSAFLFSNMSAIADAILDDNIIIDLAAHEALTLGNNAHKDINGITTPALAGGAEWDGKDWALFPKIGEGFYLHVDEPSGTGGTIPSGNYEFGLTYIYDAEPGEPGHQESLVTRMKGGGYDSGGVHMYVLGETVDIKIFATSPYDPRLTGGRIYIRKKIGGGGGTWYHFLDISLKSGARQANAGEYNAWTIKDSSATTICCEAEVDDVDSISPVTYDLNTGIAQDSPAITAKYKTAVVANRVAYIGNVQYDGITYGDSVFYSPPNKFDVFTKERELAASIHDGDSIVKLEEYADRLLQFKKRKMQLINIAQLGSEFIEETFMHKGVLRPAAVCKTDFGVAWVNREGCYLYDGQRVSNLLEKGGRRIIKEDDWNSFTTNDSMIGYFPKKRQLIVLKDSTASSGGDIYLFDMVTQSWVKGQSKFTGSQIQTNFVADWNNDLIHAHTSGTGTVAKWTDSSASSTKLNMQTKDIDFGEPATVKTVYKVYLTFRGNGAHVQVNWGYNGATPTGTFFPITSGTDGSSTGTGATNKCIAYDAGTNDWLKAELVPGTVVTDINSFRLKISADDSNAISSDFEINDIAIVYRFKGQR